MERRFMLHMEDEWLKGKAGGSKIIGRLPGKPQGRTGTQEAAVRLSRRGGLVRMMGGSQLDMGDEGRKM